MAVCLKSLSKQLQLDLPLSTDVLSMNTYFGIWFKNAVTEMWGWVDRKMGLEKISEIMDANHSVEPWCSVDVHI